MSLLQHIVQAIAVLASALGLLSADAPRPATEVLAFSPTADTFVSASAPTTSYGEVKVLEVSGSPEKLALLRFEVAGIGSARVLDVRLRLFATRATAVGGHVRRVGGPWDESTTWDSRPPYDRDVLATVGAVPAEGSWYEVDLTAAGLADGVVEYAITSAYTSDRGPAFGSRQGFAAPELLVTVERDVPSPIEPALRSVATTLEGSSSPTSYASQHRMALTAGGRTLAVHGRHLSGVQLAWRDPDDPAWSRSTIGDVVDGALAGATETGDWTSSIAVGPASGGGQHAWVVMGGDATVDTKGIFLRRLSKLDDPAGPEVGPLIEVVAPGTEAGLVDVGVEPATGAVALTWAGRAGASGYQQQVSWVVDPTGPAPAPSPPIPIATGSSAYRSGTVVPLPSGVAIAHRDGGNALRVAYHDAGDPPGAWTLSERGIAVPPKAHVAATATAGGEVVAVVPVDIETGQAAVQRFDTAGRARPVELSVPAYHQPAVAAAGDALVLVGVSDGGGAIVTRTRSGGAWSTEDRVETPPGQYAHPNAGPGGDGRLRLLLEGDPGTAQQRAVLVLERAA